MGTVCVSTRNRKVPGTAIISWQEKQEIMLLFVLFCSRGKAIYLQLTKEHRWNERKNARDNKRQHRPPVQDSAVDAEAKSLRWNPDVRLFSQIVTTCREQEAVMSPNDKNTPSPEGYSSVIVGSPTIMSILSSLLTGIFHLNPRLRSNCTWRNS